MQGVVELGRNVGHCIRALLYGASGLSPTIPDMLVRPPHGLLGNVVVPEQLGDWATQEDVEY
ncbi:MAG: hypothetical protein JO318_13270 [Chloroflexi bacterium]|nr:hypothetical protein [Chloroflexota bacterium]